MTDTWRVKRCIIIIIIIIIIITVTDFSGKFGIGSPSFTLEEESKFVI